MLSNEYSLTVNGSTISMVRVNQDNYGSVYRGESGLKEYTLTIKHTIPPRGKPNESHMIRLDCTEVDAEGAFLGTTSAWAVAKTPDRVQDSAESVNLLSALVAFLPSDSGNTVSVAERVVKRES